MGLTIQDAGRTGCRRFGVPRSGVMDGYAADWANRLLDNPPASPVVEILFQGLRIRALQPVWIAVTGAAVESGIPAWSTARLEAGQVIEFSKCVGGVWSYLAVEGGIASERVLGSASQYLRGGIGKLFQTGDCLHRNPGHDFHLPPGIASRAVAADSRRDYLHPPKLRVWPGPQWHLFSVEDRARFFEQTWTLSSQSDRAGYRITGPALTSQIPSIISEPVPIGSIQVPPNGQPIVTMPDGPTVGGYPKLGILENDSLGWLAQTRPGQSVSFSAADETRT